MIATKLLPPSVLILSVALIYYRLLESSNGDPTELFQFCFCAVVSFLGYTISITLIPKVKNIFIERGGLWGYDINKGGKEHGVKVYDYLFYY